MLKVGASAGIETAGAGLTGAGAAAAGVTAVGAAASVVSGGRFFNWSLGLLGASAAGDSIGEEVSTGVCVVGADSAACAALGLSVCDRRCLSFLVIFHPIV